MKKLLVVGVIGLFLGLACAPSVNANVSKESELLEITTEICGFDGGKHTVQLTKEESEEVDGLFKSIRDRLNTTESREEVKEIFNDAVVKLDTYGLLGGISVEQAQKLVNGGYQYSRIIQIIERLYNKSQPDIDKNSSCLITGYSKGGTLAIPLPSLFVLVLLEYYMLNIYPYVHLFITILFEILISCLGLSTLPLTLSPVKCLSGLSFGFYDWNRGMYVPASGWVYTINSSGSRNWTGKFYGDIVEVYGLMMLYFCLGAFGFTGIIIKRGFNGHFNLYNAFYLGSALSVKLSYEPPNI